MKDTGLCRRAGVQSREEVLKQVRRNGLEIIEIDADPAPTSNRAHEPQSYHSGHYTPRTHPVHSPPLMQKRTQFPELDSCSQPAKRRKLLDSIDFHPSTTQTERYRSSLASTSTSTGNVSTAQDYAPKQKKPLFPSSNAKENMLKTSSLPSPESTSSSRTIEFTSPLCRNESGPSRWVTPSWGFGNLDESNTTDDSVSTTVGGQIIAEPGSARSQDSSRGENTAAAPNPLDQRQKEMEQTSVTESQRLRAQHQNRMKRPTLIRSTTTHKQTPVHDRKGVAQQSRSGQNAAQSHQTISSSNRDEDDPDELKRSFEAVRNYKWSEQRPPGIRGDRGEEVCSHKSHESQPNPYSREAAEKWRTQSRHLGHSRQPSESPSSEPRKDYEVADNHIDDVRLAQVRATAYQKKLITRDREAEKRLLRQKFYVVDLEEGCKKKKKSTSKFNSKPPARTQTEVQSDLRKLMGTTKSTETLHETNSGDPKSNADVQNEISGEAQQRSFPTPTLSALNQLGPVTQNPGAVSNVENSDLKEIFDNLPGQATELNTTPPKYFDKFTNGEKQLYIERDTKKERDKDLDLICTVFTMAAQLGSLDAFDTGDPKLVWNMTYLRMFTEAVVENQKSGKPVRSQIRSIRDTFKRRLDGIDKEADMKAADEFLPVLLQPELFEKLSSESKQVKVRLVYLVAECNRINISYHNKSDHPKKARAKVSFSTKDPTGKFSGYRSSTQSKPPTTKQKLAELHALRDQYNQNSSDHEDEVEEIDLGPSRNDIDDGEISEEDEGEDFVRPAGFQGPNKPATGSEEESPDHVNSSQGSDLQQANVDSVSNTQPSQGLDQQLLNRMLAKRQQQNHLKLQGVQESDSQVVQEGRQRKLISATSLKKPKTVSIGAAESEDSEEEADYDIEQGSSKEFDDSDIDVESDEEGDDNEPVCRRYIAKGVCHGLAKRYDEYEHQLGKYLEKEQAKKKIQEFKEWFKTQVPKCHPDLEFNGFRELMHETKGSFEQKIIFGDGEDVVCRAWFTEELHHPSEEAYRKAKVYRACQPKSIWIVDWKRTIAPYKEPEEDASSNNEITDTSDNSDKFEDGSRIGEDTSEPDSSPSSQMIQPDRDHALDEEQKSKELGKSNEDLISPDNPVDSFLSSSATILVSDTDHSAKDCLMHDVDAAAARVEMDVDTTDSTEDMDDLFGGEPDFSSINADSPAHSLRETPPTEPLSRQTSVQRNMTPCSILHQTTVTRPTPDQVRCFATRSFANRHAKNVFMHWYIERLPKVEDYGHIKVADESMEEDLRSIGDQGCWKREEEVYEYRSDDTAPDGKTKVTDHLSVWVTEKKLYGPQN